jgi:uncharacterized protein (DUF1501 family)
MNMTRRYFLKTSGALAAYCGVAPFRVLADTQGAAPQVMAGRTLVVIFLRGGVDGLNWIVPFQEAAYYQMRQSIAIPQPGKTDGALDLDGVFGLHPRSAALMPLFQSGLASALHAVGYDKNTRSHFEEQDVWETGVIGNTVSSDGWLNRHLATSQGRGPIRAVSVGDSLPRILRGKAPAYAFRGLTDLAMPDAGGEPGTIAAALEHAYCSEPRQHLPAARDLLAQTAGATLEGLRVLNSVAAQKHESGAKYPDTPLGRSLQTVARLIQADIGLEIAEVDYGGWDTHNNQGGVGGAFGNLLQGLAEALAAFAADLEGRMDDVVLVTMSDFGRTAAENGSRGTDHGWANCLLALGGPVRRAGQGKPRKVIGRWPGLAKEKLHEGRDLLHTTDFRDVFAELVRVHLGNPHLETVLPQHKFQPVGLVG